jgi:hypothetical protein
MGDFEIRTGSGNAAGASKPSVAAETRDACTPNQQISLKNTSSAVGDGRSSEFDDAKGDPLKAATLLGKLISKHLTLSKKSNTSRRVREAHTEPAQSSMRL